MPTQIQISTATKTLGSKIIAYITLDGQIDESNLESFKNALNPLIGDDRKFILLNLAKLEFINSKVIGYLASLHSQLAEQNQRIIFVEPNQNILDILELVGLTQIMPTFETETKALTAIEQNEV